MTASASSLPIDTLEESNLAKQKEAITQEPERQNRSSDSSPENKSSQATEFFNELLIHLDVDRNTYVENLVYVNAKSKRLESHSLFNVVIDSLDYKDRKICDIFRILRDNSSRSMLNLNNEVFTIKKELAANVLTEVEAIAQLKTCQRMLAAKNNILLKIVPLLEKIPAEMRKLIQVKETLEELKLDKVQKNKLFRGVQFFYKLNLPEYSRENEQFQQLLRSHQQQRR